MDQTLFLYYFVIIAILAIVLFFTYRWIHKFNENAKCSADVITVSAEEYSAPLEIIMPAFSTTLRNFEQVALYPDYIIQGRVKIMRDDIDCVTFNNYAPAEMPNEYQVIVRSTADAQTMITIPVGDDLHYAATLTDRIRELYTL